MAPSPWPCAGAAGTSPGLDADAERLAEALRSGVVDQAGDDLDAGVIFMAVPAAAVADEARRILATPGRRPDAVVTDVSGVKTAIVEAADHPRFIGGHPMAGSEQVGLRGADPDLFEGAVWVLTPTAETDLDAFTTLQGVVTALGADVLVLSAAGPRPPGGRGLARAAPGGRHA